jgi:hypothetical protein
MMTAGRRSFSGGVLGFVVMITCGLLPGCRHTPSYSDIKVDKSGSLANSNAARPEAEGSTDSGNPLAMIPQASPVPDASAGPGPAPPSFLDPKTGQIRNLPLYPGARVRNVQFGPINGTPQVTVQAFVRAPFERVTAFYDQAVKENGWTIDDNSRDADSYVWQLSRGQTDHAAIRVDKDQLGRVTIGMARTAQSGSK